MIGEKFQSHLWVEGDGGGRDRGPRIRSNYLYHIISSQQLAILDKLQKISSNTLGVQIE